MKWQEICDQYPHQWLLVEATSARSENNERILDEIAVLDRFSDSATAMKDYAQLHKKAPERELYVFHTDRKALNISEKRWLEIWGQYI